MAFCSNCGSEIPDGSKFCQNCGQKASAEPVAVEPMAYTPPVEEPIAYTPPAAEPVSYTPPAAEPVSYTPPAAESVSYTPPAANQNSYTPPSTGGNGSYTPPQSGGGGSYIPPQSSYTATAAPKSSGGKKKMLPIIIAGVAVVAIIVVVLVLVLGGKGKSGGGASDPNLGVYTAVSAEMWGIEMDASSLFEGDFTVELKSGGKCTVAVYGTTSNGSWELENGALTMEAGGVNFAGTLADGVMKLENVMDMEVNVGLTIEGYTGPSVSLGEAFGSGSGTDTSGGTVGPAIDEAIIDQWDGVWYGSLYMNEATGDYASMSEELYDVYLTVELEADGTGIFSVFLDGSEYALATGECTVNENSLTATTGDVAGGLDLDSSWMLLPRQDYTDMYSISNEVEDSYGYMDFTLSLKQWGNSWQTEINDGFNLTPPSVAGYQTSIENGAAAPTFIYASAATTLGEAFEGVTPISGLATGEGNDAGETLTGRWYGWMREDDCWGGHAESFVSIEASINYTSDGQKYFEVFKNSDIQNPVISMWIEDEETDTEVIPLIGDEDAWVLDTYLVASDADDIDAWLYGDGSFYFSFDYTSYDGTSGCYVTVYMRKDGAEWDEEYDELPPDYEEYKANLG